jgi:hypothetical protein
MRGQICYRTQFEDGSEAFDPDPSLIDRHPEYTSNTDTHLGDRPPTPTQQREERYKLHFPPSLSIVKSVQVRAGRECIFAFRS